MARHLASGAAAEDFAARALERQGYRVLARNVRNAAGEIDIVAFRRGAFAFVEVKARRAGGRAGTAHEALTPAKLRRVGRAADRLLADRGQAGAERVLIGAAVELAPDGTPTSVEFVPVEETR